MNLLLKLEIILEIQGAIFSLLISLILKASKQKIYRGGNVLAVCIFLNMCLLLADVACYVTDGVNNIWAFVLIRISNFSVFFIEYMLVILITHYVYTIVKHRNPGYSLLYKRIIHGFMAIDTILLICNQFVGIFYYIDSNNRYVRLKLCPLSVMIAALCMVVLAIILFQNWGFLKRYERMEMITFLSWPITGAVLEVFVVGYSFVTIGITISVFCTFAAYMRRLQKWKQERDLKLLQSQAYLLNSQIKPHFLFNSLNVIQSLIEEDPETAVKAVDRFSKFLRTGLKIEVTKSLVPLKTEMDYVDDYLYLEQLRHGDKIHVVKDIQPGIDFQIPFLTIQPIVENAIRHGICKKIKGGTVVISIKRDGSDNVIRVTDDGIGFLPVENEKKEWDPGDTGTSGIGTDNVRNRLAMMCGGSLEIDSAPGEGTMVIIRIPVQ